MNAAYVRRYVSNTFTVFISTNNAQYIYFFILTIYIYYNHCYIFQYTCCIILGKFQRCTSLKLRSFYVIRISLKLPNENIYVVLIKCIQYDFYSIICISNMFTRPYMQSGYSAINTIKFKIM